jgi:hypothetical protein
MMPPLNISSDEADFGSLPDHPDGFLETNPFQGFRSWKNINPRMKAMQWSA